MSPWEASFLKVRNVSLESELQQILGLLWASSSLKTRPRLVISPAVSCWFVEGKIREILCVRLSAYSLLKPSSSDHSFCIWCVWTFPAHSPLFFLSETGFSNSSTVAMIFCSKHGFCVNLVLGAKGAQYPLSFPPSSSGHPLFILMCSLPTLLGVCSCVSGYGFVTSIHRFFFFFFRSTVLLILVVLGIHQRKWIQFNIFDVFVRRPFVEFE